MSRDLRSWAPAAVLLAGLAAASGLVVPPRTLELRAPLAETVPLALEGAAGKDQVISEGEQRVAGMSDYLMRVYEPAAGAAAGAAAVAAPFSVYVGYYDHQAQGKTIHSPKNCLPGAGWEALTNTRETIQTPLGAVAINRYVIQNGKARALVLYWYQGRGRVVANEYTVKWNLLRDQALHGRSDEALVRVIVPMTGKDAAEGKLAERVASQVMVAVSRALPAA